MVHTRTSEDPLLDIPESSARRGSAQAPCGNAPPPPLCPPVSLEVLLTTSNELIGMLMENEARRGASLP
jgi:hypothetical protein